MDRYATLSVPAQDAFRHLADPARLGEWLPEVVAVDAGRHESAELGEAFAVTVRASDRDEVLQAEVVAHEPPWLISYRLLTESPVLIRATCTVQSDGTRVHVHQTDGAASLTIDLTRLGRALAGTAEPTADIGAPASGDP